MNDWRLGPFGRQVTVLREDPSLTFECPVTERKVAWAAKDVFNPSVVVRNGLINLLFRAEDTVGPIRGTSRIGLATSEDGLTFHVEPEPVLFPIPGRWQPWEWPGGCEDPRVVEAPDGGYVCYYTAFDGKKACLCAASSDDLRSWKRHGPAFAGTDHAGRWSKSGAVVTEIRDGRVVATRVGDRYWMYWGEGLCFAATSEDLIHWRPSRFDAGWDRYLTVDDSFTPPSLDIQRIQGQRVARPVLHPRPGRFDGLLVEPGPSPVLTEDGIVMIYNGAQVVRGEGAASIQYAPGQALFDPMEPGSCLERDTAPFLSPEQLDGRQGQVEQVCFAEGLVLFEDSWWLYYGMADSRIGCVTAPASR
jgi:predicted GH43/DUF377 family glycosyl hydrolase